MGPCTEAWSLSSRGTVRPWRQHEAIYSSATWIALGFDLYDKMFARVVVALASLLALMLFLVVHARLLRSGRRFAWCRAMQRSEGSSVCSRRVQSSWLSPVRLQQLSP